MEHFTVTRLLSATLSGPSVLDAVDVFRLSLLFRSVAPVLRRLLSFLFGCMQAISLPAPALVFLLDAAPDDMEKTTSTFPVDAFGIGLVTLIIGFVIGAVWLFVTRTPVRFDDSDSTPVADWIVNSITHSTHISSGSLGHSPMPSEIDLTDASPGSADDSPNNRDSITSGLEASINSTWPHPTQITRLLWTPAVSQFPEDYSTNPSPELEDFMDRSSSSGLAAYLPLLSPSSASSSPSDSPCSNATYRTLSEILDYSHMSENVSTEKVQEAFARDLLPESTSCRLPTIPSLDFDKLSVGDIEDPLVLSGGMISRIAVPPPLISQGRRSCPQDVRGAGRTNGIIARAATASPSMSQGRRDRPEDVRGTGYPIGIDLPGKRSAAARPISTASHLRIRVPSEHGLPRNPQDVRGSGRRYIPGPPSARTARRPQSRSRGAAPPAIGSKYASSDYKHEAREAIARCNELRRRGAELNERIEKTTKRIAKMSARWREAEERRTLYELAEASGEEPPPPKPPPEPPSTWDLELDELPEPPVELPPIPTPDCSMTEDEDDD
ncbi:hypothetical protein OE88DRAFT_1811950 [Heliocybe sulcata]|uniref:Uncharacterized protein n=1 Tax=Heliocybe sulcata TaxID=5364 RepID=A0A5C3MLZ8_9AGAM|nr:hypothetical protein OE88DRAFT_1811950 [Heliocybe sulcata]